MIYYSGKEITVPLILVLTLALALWAGFAMDSSCKRYARTEKVIGYEIDEMRTPDNRPYFDTVRVILKKGDFYFVKDYGNYKHLSKESTLVRELDPIKTRAVHTGPSYEGGRPAHPEQKILNTPSTEKGKATP